MRYSKKHKFLLVSNWKCGCSSIAGMFAPYSDNAGKNKNKICKKTFGVSYHVMVHWPAFKIKKEFEKKGWNWDDFVKITSVRNPWARIVSLFFYKYRKSFKGKQVPLKKVKKKFTEFVKKEVPHWKGGIRNRWVSEEMIHDPRGKKLVDYVVRLEHLKEDLTPILEKHFPQFAPFNFEKKRNTTEHLHYSYYYNSETRKLVAKMFQYEIHKFKYRFEKPKPKAVVIGPVVEKVEAVVKAAVEEESKAS